MILPLIKHGLTVKKAVFVLALLILPLIFAGRVFAEKEIQHNETVTLEKDQIIDSDYFTAGRKITISGTVNGDAYVAGEDVTIDGTINGDLLVAGQSVKIRGKIKNDVRAAGFDISVEEGQIGGNLTTIGPNVDVGAASVVTGGFTGVASTLHLASDVGKNAYFVATNPMISSKIGGSIKARTQNLSLDSKTNIGGDLVYWSENRAQIAPDAKIAGSTRFNQLPKQNHQPVNPREIIARAALGLRVVSLTSSLIAGFLLIKFFPVATAKTTALVAQRPVASLLYGILLMILVPVIILILMLTIIGIPFALILIAGFLITLYFAKIFVAITIGARFSSDNPVLVLFVGIGLYYLVASLPAIGMLVVLIVTALGLGAQFLSRLAYYKELHSKKLI